MDDVTKYTKHARAAVVYVAPFILLLALGVVLNVTNPLETGAASILGVFILLYLFIFSILAALLKLATSIVRMVKHGSAITSSRRGYYVVSIISLAPVLFVALNTLGQLEALEIVLIVLLVALGCFYVLRRSQK